MNSKLKFILSFVVGAVCSAWITILADPLGRKIIVFLESTPSKTFTFARDYISSFLPIYESQNISTMWGIVGMSLLLGIMLRAYKEAVDKVFDNSVDEEPFVATEEKSEIEILLLDLFGIFSKFFKTHIVKHLNAIFLSTAFCFFGFLTLRSAIVTELATQTLRKIEIVSPYVDDLAYKKFKSEFYTIQTWSDYNRLHEKLDSVLKAEGISLTH